MGKETVLITGCSRGIGRACAVALASAGYKVFASVRLQQDVAPLEAFARDLYVRPVILDVDDASSRKSALDTMKAEGFGVDVLVNKAGFGLMGAPEELPL